VIPVMKAGIQLVMMLGGGGSQGMPRINLGAAKQPRKGSVEL